MSPVEVRLAELRAALGDRLPPAVHDARLREARTHLLASAEEVGEVEAARRYGRPCAVANALVREYRGYDGRSAYSLGLPLGASFFALSVASTLLITFYHSAPWLQAPIGVGKAIPMLIVLAYVRRVVQTRRWLVAPMLAWHATGLVSLELLEVTRDPSGVGPLGEAALLATNLLALGASWAALNALGLVAGRLLDRRRVRRIRGAR